MWPRAHNLIIHVHIVIVDIIGAASFLQRVAHTTIWRRMIMNSGLCLLSPKQ